HEQLVDGDDADDLILDLEGNGGQRPFQRDYAVVEIKALSARGNGSNHAFAETRGKRIDVRKSILAVTGDRAQLLGVLVKEQDRERLRADEIEEDLLNDVNDFAKIECGVKLIAGNVEAGQVVVLLFDFGVSRGVILIGPLNLAELRPQPLILPQQLLGELLALVEQLEKLLSSRFVAHLSARNSM